MINNTKTHENDIAVECARVRACKWKGMESDMIRKPGKPTKIGMLTTQTHHCPECGSAEFYRRDAVLIEPRAEGSAELAKALDAIAAIAVTPRGGFTPRIRPLVMKAIHQERDAQDAQWGGPEHDDEHSYGSWSFYISLQIAKGRAECGKNIEENPGGPYGTENTQVKNAQAVRARLVKIAALAIAGIESIDRQTETGQVSV